MKKIVFFSLLSCFIKINAQYNYVANPGFELPLGANSSCNDQTPESTHANLFLKWSTTPPWEPPALPNFCLHLKDQQGTADLLCTDPGHLPDGHNSIRYAYTGGGEYIQQQLDDGTNNIPLTANHLYYVEYWIKSTSTPPSYNGGIKFYMKSPRQCGSTKLSKPTPWNPDVAIPSILYITDGNWHKVSGYYQAADNFPYMAIGDMRHTIGTKSPNDDKHDFNMKWDDFKIIDVGNDFCSSINYMQNIDFQNIDGIVYKSQLLTIAGSNVNSSQTTGNVIVDNTANVNIQSETQVALKSGFSVPSGGTLHAYIAPCNSNCPIISSYVGGEESYCSMPGQTVQLGGGSSSVGTYQWTANYANGSPCNCLSNTTISNPLLTIPSGSGALDISVTAYNTCDGTSTTDEQSIYYDDNPSTNPVISVTPSNITISASNPNAYFTINGDTHVEDVVVQLFDQNNNLINEVDIDDFPLTTQGSYSYYYNYPDFSYAPLDPCLTYTYKVYSKNICSDNTGTPATVNVAPVSAITITNLPNVFTPNGDGINDTYCWGVIGATAYNITVIDEGGATVYTNSGPVYNNLPCATVWDGSCNNTCGTEGGGIVCNGTYYYLLEFTGCPGTSPYIHVDFLSIYGSCGGNSKVENQNDTTNTSNMIPSSTLNDPSLPKNMASNGINSKLGNNVTAFIFPNPTTGLISLNVNVQNSGTLLLNILNPQGISIINNTYNTSFGMNNFHLNLSSLTSGVYFISITDENGISIKNEKIILIGQ